MTVFRPTTGARLVPTRLGELRRLLRDLDAEDLGALDPSLGEWMRRKLGREALATVVLPAAGSVFLALLNVEPAGLIVLERGEIAARIRVLAVAPDMRRRGLARTILRQAGPVAHERDIAWLWMSIAADNAVATRCALTGGFRRFRPQYLRRELLGALTVTNSVARIEALDDDAGLDEATRWIAYESNTGDAWCAELAQADLLKWTAPRGGKFYLCILGDSDVGLAHIERIDAGHARIGLWLEQRLWGTPLERAVFKGVVDMMLAAPERIDLELGSADHLRASVDLYRALGFKPVLHDRVTFVQRVASSQGVDSGASSA